MLIINDTGVRPAARCTHDAREHLPHRGTLGVTAQSRPPQTGRPLLLRLVVRSSSRAGHCSKRIAKTRNGAGVLGGEGSQEREASKVCSVLLVRVWRTDGQGLCLGGRGVCGLPGGVTHLPSVSPPSQGGCWGCNMCPLLKVPALPGAGMASGASFASGA